MSEENLGSGQYLDETLDFEVDTTGDIRASDGIEELEKDLSFQMIISLSRFLGDKPTQETASSIKRIAYRVAVADDRVSSVIQEDITVEWNDEFKSFDVAVPVTTETNTNYQLVFEV